MTSVTDLRELVEVVIGVDTHVHEHAAAAVDARTGAVLGQVRVSADVHGFARLVVFADRYSPARFWAVEGTSSHGAGLCRYLLGDDLVENVIELDRPERMKRRHGAKSDEIDAVRAAREALARPQLGVPRSGARRDRLAALLAVRASAVQGAADGARQLFGLTVSAPQVLRDRVRVESSTAAMVDRAAVLRISKSWDADTAAMARVLRRLAKRVQSLEAEAAELEKQIKAVVKSWKPALLDVHGVGPIVAATVLCAWSHPGRIRSRGAFAMLAGAAPIPASSGEVTRYRLNRSGDRRLNWALHHIVLVRMQHDPRTKRYVQKWQSESNGRKKKSKREIRRCLKTYVARELYGLLEYGDNIPSNGGETPAHAA